MSGSSSIMHSISMHDNVKHVYHSIPMEPAGAITMTERSRFCGNSKKVMTLILASALLWIIVLDIMLVVYKSHHLNNTEQVDIVEVPHSHGVFINSKHIGQTLGGEKAKQKFVSPTPGARHAVANTVALIAAPATVQTQVIAKRFDVSIIGGPVHTPISGWLSRLRHPDLEPHGPLRKPEHSHFPINKPMVTPPGHFKADDYKVFPPPPHAPGFSFPFHGIIPPPPPMFLPLPRQHHLRDMEQGPHMRRPWAGPGEGEGRWARERGIRRSDGVRTHDPWATGEEVPLRLRPMAPIPDMPEPFPKIWQHVQPNAAKIRSGLDMPSDDVIHVNGHHGDHLMPENFFFKLINSFIDGAWNSTDTELHTFSHESAPHQPKLINMLNDNHDDGDDDDDDDDADDAIIDINISA